MSDSMFDLIRQEISEHPDNVRYSSQGISPLFLASPSAKIVIIGQAPGIHAQTSGIVWDDASGVRLMRWLGVDSEQFRDTSLFAHLPMDFYYPGKGRSGDMPPRKDFAQLWHPRILQLMPNVQLTLLIGQYAQKYYLSTSRGRTLTETVGQYQTYLPEYFPIVHPSPLNFRWMANNAWFEQEIVPVLQATVADILSKKSPPK